VCTYRTETLDIEGSGKGAGGWFSLNNASVYFDHPVHSPVEHTLNIDFLNPGAGPAARVELDRSSAEELAHAILRTLASTPDL
jgi:hypothetical protein